MRAETDAALARYRAVWKSAQVHEAGKVPASPVTPYASVSVSAGGAGNYNNAAQHGSRSYRIVAQIVGKSVTEVALAVEGAEAAYLDQRLTIADLDTTPCLNPIATDPYRDPDAGGLLTCTLVYTFNTYPTE